MIALYPGNMTRQLLHSDNLPPRFSYPRQFSRLIRQGLVDLEPWYILFGEPLREARQGLLRRYPERDLVPFAKRQDTDDHACWSASSETSVLIIHDFATAGYELRREFSGFNDWLRSAVEDYIAFEP